MRRTGKTVAEAEVAANHALDEFEAAIKRYEALPDGDPRLPAAKAEMDNRSVESHRLSEELDHTKAIWRARNQHTAEPLDGETRGGLSFGIREPDMYARASDGFLRDLYWAQCKSDPSAQARVARHHEFELTRMEEERAMATGTLGGIIPPQYLVDMYAKAPRNGRVFADQVNRQDLPEVGMSLIVPRITTPPPPVPDVGVLDVTTQDVAETDLTVPVRTIGGYLPVSRQALERAAYSETILFEDLIARVLVALSTRSASPATATPGRSSGCFTRRAGLDLGELGRHGHEAVASSGERSAADPGEVGRSRHPARQDLHAPAPVGQRSRTTSTTSRPIFGYNNASAGLQPGRAGQQALRLRRAYPGAPGLSTRTSRSTSTRTATATRSSSRRRASCTSGSGSEDPVTLAFEQQAGTSLQVQLIAYGVRRVHRRPLPGRDGDYRRLPGADLLGPRRSPGQAGSSARHKRIAARSCPMGPLDPWTSLRTRPVCAWLARLPGGRKRRAPLPE